MYPWRLNIYISTEAALVTIAKTSKAAIHQRSSPLSWTILQSARGRNKMLKKSMHANAGTIGLTEDAGCAKSHVCPSKRNTAGEFQV